MIALSIVQVTHEDVPKVEDGCVHRQRLIWASQARDRTA